MWSGTGLEDASTRQLKRILLKLRFSQSSEMDRLLYTISRTSTLPEILKNKLAKIEPMIADLDVYTQLEETAEWRRIVLDLVRQHLFETDDEKSSTTDTSPDLIDESWPIPGIGRLKAETLRLPVRRQMPPGRADEPNEELFQEFRCILYRMFSQLNSPEWVYDRLDALKLEHFKIKHGFVEVLRRMEATGFAEVLEKGGEAIDDFRQQLIELWNRVGRLVGAGAVALSEPKPAEPEKAAVKSGGAAGGDAAVEYNLKVAVEDVDRTVVEVTNSSLDSYHLPPPQLYIEPAVESFEPADKQLRESTTRMVAGILGQLPGSSGTRLLGSEHLNILVESLELCSKMTNPFPVDDPLHLDFLLDLVSPMLPSNLWIQFLNRCGQLIYVKSMHGLKLFLVDQIKAHRDRGEPPVNPKVAEQLAAVERAMECIEELNYPKTPGPIEKRIEEAIEMLPTLNYIKDIDGYERLLEGFQTIENIVGGGRFDEETLEVLIDKLPWKKSEQYRNFRGKRTLSGLIDFVAKTLQKARSFELPAVVAMAQRAGEQAKLEYQARANAIEAAAPARVDKDWPVSQVDFAQRQADYIRGIGPNPFPIQNNYR